MEENIDQILGSAHEVLTQGEELLRLIGDDDYTRVARPAFSSGIGAHYRHCLDHFTSFLRGTRDGEINFDTRDRDSNMEIDRLFVLEQTQAMLRAVINLDRSLLTRSVRITAKVQYASTTSQTAMSTFERELMYVVAHAMHHYALIRVMASLLEIRLPAEFGVAPSTLQHLRNRGNSIVSLIEECEPA